jgi:hypothetical protein
MLLLATATLIVAGESLSLLLTGLATLQAQVALTSPATIPELVAR